MIVYEVLKLDTERRRWRCDGRKSLEAVVGFQGGTQIRREEHPAGMCGGVAFIRAEVCHPTNQPDLRAQPALICVLRLFS